MRTARFPQVLSGAATLAGYDATPDATARSRIAEFLNQRIEQGWTWDFWPEWTQCEQRAYRPIYDSETNYAAPTATSATEVFFEPAQAYYQTLRATTGNDPATASGDLWTADPAYWAECAISYSGDDWAQDTAYTAGTTVRNPADNRYYSCFEDHTSGSSFDGTKFGVLTPFERYVSLDQPGLTPIGEVKAVYDSDPRLGQRDPAELPFVVTDRGIEPRNGSLTGAAGWFWPWTGGGSYGAGFIPTQVWVEFRLRPPCFTAASYDNTATYYADDVVCNDGDGQDGECYKALVDSPGTDLTDGTKWAKQSVPRILANWAKRAAAADLQRPAGQHEKARAEDSPAFEFLLQAHDLQFAGQGQYDTAKARSY